MLSRDIKPTAYWLELEVVPTRERFSGHVRIAIDLARDATSLWLHGKNLHVTEAHAEQAGHTIAANFRQVDDNGMARLEFGAPLQRGSAVLDLVYDAPFDRQLTGLYRVDSEGASYAFTQFESISARKAFPCFDEPGFKTPFDVTLVVPGDETAISNTPERSNERNASGLRRVRFGVTKPLPTYLLAFIVGPLDVVNAAPIAPNAVRSTPLALRGVAARGRGPRLQYALEHTGPLVAELERYFGIAYPFEKLDLIAVPDFGPGAMENAGAITFREQYLMLDPKFAPEAQRRKFDNIVAHELAHHWTGDLVTMHWWDDTWLNEAFATFMATRVVNAVRPESGAREALLTNVLAVMNSDSRVSARKIRQPIDTTHDIANAFDSITYQKGAGVIAMFERHLGDEVFRQGVQRYLRAHAYGNATAADLLLALSQASGKDVAALMNGFLDQEGVPLVHAEVRCAKEGATLALRQERYLPVGSTGTRDQRWQVPICVRYAVRGVVQETCGVLEAAEGSLALPGGCPDWLLPNADGAGYYRWSLPAPSLDKLLKAGFGQLNAREKLSVADGLHAGFESGAVPAQSLLAALPTLAADADHSVAGAPLEMLRFIRDYVLLPEDRPALDHFAQGLYARRLHELGWNERANESGDDKLLRADLAAFLALGVRDRALRSAAKKLGARYMSMPEPGTMAAIDELAADVRGTLAAVAMQEGDGALFDAVRAQLAATQDPTQRDRCLYALSSVTDARSARVLELTLDPVLRVNEMLTPLRAQLGDERTRDAAWTFFEQHLDVLIQRTAKERAGGLPWLAGSFCSAAMADRVQALFAPRIDSLMGGPRSLAGVVEALRLCGAEVELQRASARAFFSTLH